MKGFGTGEAEKKHRSAVKDNDEKIINYREFRAVLIYLRQHFEFWCVFDQIDSSHNHRIDYAEFLKALRTLKVNMRYIYLYIYIYLYY